MCEEECKAPKSRTITVIGVGNPKIGQAVKALQNAGGSDIDAFTARLLEEEATSGDSECDHMKADSIVIGLLEFLGFTKTVETFRRIDKWYS